jgi:voltage-gated potassium channel Kch
MPTAPARTRRASPGARLRYAFDRSLSRGTPALVAWLAAVSLVLIVAFSLVIWAARLAPEGDGGARPGFLRIAWMSLMRTLDAGTMGGDQGSWPFLLSMFGVTLGGVFVVSAFIGVLTSGLERRLEALRKGRSQVLEAGHTVILGWSPLVFDIVAELVTANENHRRATVVVLGQADKVEMEDALRERVPDRKTTRIVCRSGDPAEMADLDRVAVQDAKSIVVLAPEGPQPDIAVIKTLLALTHSPTRRPEPYHIVAELREPRNLEVARLAGRGEAKLVLAGDLISRITAQTCRQPGLSVVYQELLDFGGDEIYFQAEPSLEGKTFGEALAAFEDSAVIGLFQRGEALLNPPMDTRIGAGDQLIAISEDDDTVAVSGRPPPAVDERRLRAAAPATARPESVVFLGWNWRVPTMLQELDAYVPAGSRALVVTHHDIAAEIEALRERLPHQALSYVRGDTSSRPVLERLRLPEHDHAVVVCDEEVPPAEADARTLITLLHLRDMADRSGKRVPVVSEMLDVRNRDLAEVTRADDFVVSDKLIALLLSQISENGALDDVFRDLLDPEGSEIYLKPIAGYVETGMPLDFYTVLEAARRRGEVAIGYRIAAAADDAGKAHGVVVNPEKSALVTYAPGDRVIVLAES